MSPRETTALASEPVIPSPEAVGEEESCFLELAENPEERMAFAQRVASHPAVRKALETFDNFTWGFLQKLNTADPRVLAATLTAISAMSIPKALLGQVPADPDDPRGGFEGPDDLNSGAEDHDGVVGSGLHVSPKLIGTVATVAIIFLVRAFRARRRRPRY